MILPPSDEDYTRAGAALLGRLPEVDAAPEAPEAPSDLPDSALADDPTQGAAARPRIVNTVLAAALLDDAVLVLHLDGRDLVLKVPALPSPTGMLLYHFEQVIDDLWTTLRSQRDRNPHTNEAAASAMRSLALAFAEVAGILWRSVVPASRWRALWWRVHGRPANPFLRLEYPDLERCLRFFSRARTSTRLMWRASDRAPLSLTWIWHGTSSLTGPIDSVPAGRMGTR